MPDIYRKNKYENLTEENDLKEMIKVVPSSFKWLLVGIGIALLVTVLWLLLGVKGTTVSVSGIYHPGADAKGEVLCFPNAVEGKQIAEGMSVSIYLDGYDQSKYGHLKGVVTYVDPYVTSTETMMELLGESTVVNVFAKNAPCVLVTVKLLEDPSSANGYAASNEKGGSVVMNDGMFLTASVLISEEHPLLQDVF